VPLFLAAAGVLALEVLLTRVFSVIMWYHFASMAIAVAMFGLSAGGLLPYLVRWRDGRGTPGIGGLPGSSGAAFAAASGLLCLIPYLVLLLFSRYPLWASRLLSLFHQPYFEPFRAAGGESLAGRDALQIGLLLLLLSLPFAGAGAIFATAFSERGREGRTYLLVMGGSAAGVAAYLLAMRAGSGPAAFPFVSALFFLSAASFSLQPQNQNGDVPKTPLEQGQSWRSGMSRFWGSFRNVPVLGFLVVAGGGVLLGFFEARYGFAEIRFVRGRYEPGLLWARWDAVSRVAVFPSSGEESARAWGVSPAYAGPAPGQIGMVVDDTGYTALFGVGEAPETLGAFRGNVASAAYHVRPGASALVIGPGGGKDILCAVASGARSVTAVEVNPLVVRAADDLFGGFTGRPYRMPGVRAVVAEGRHFLSSDPGRYDVIQMTQVFGRVPPSAGAFTMTEDHLHTVEAFRSYLDHLADDGVLTITRFVYERRVWRLLALSREALLSLGAADPSRHVVAFRDRGLINILVRRAPWTPEDISRARRFSETKGFPILFSPERPATGLPARILAGEGAREPGPFDFSAPTDDRPFYYYTLKPGAFLSAGRRRGEEFDDRAVTMLRGFLLSAGALCAAFLVVPGALLSRRERGNPAVAATAYMFLVGLAFILWEIVMIKRLAPLFGAPVLSLAAGLALILAGSAAGGYLAGMPGRRSVPGWLLAASVAASAFLFLAGPSLSRFAGAPLPARVAVAAAYVLPPSLLMGRFFPEGLRRYSGEGGGMAPFLFAANGAASVLGAALTQALTLNLGYGTTTLAGGGLYVLCAAILGAAGKEVKAG